MVRFLSLLLVVFVFVGCGSGTRLVVREKTQQPQQITMGGERQWVKVRTEVNDTIVDFRGREFVFRGLVGYSGDLTLDNVDLEIGDAEVEIDEDTLEVTHGELRATLEHGDLPEGKRVVYSKGSLTVE